MVNPKDTMTQNEFERPRASTALITEEGQLLIGAINASTGAQEVKECDASTPSGWTFVGFSKLDSIGIHTVVDVEEGLEVPATADGDGHYDLELAHGLITTEDNDDGDVSVYDEDSEEWLAVGSSASDGVFIVSDAANGVIRFHSAQAGVRVTVRYRRTISAKERDMVYQQRHMNNRAQEDLQVVGIQSGPGYVSTDQFDTSVGDWATGTLKTGQNGRITIGGSGIDLSNKLRVIKVPSADNRFITLEFI